MIGYLSLAKAADYLGFHPEVLRKKASHNEIPARKVGKGKKAPWRFVKDELDEWISNNRKIEQTISEFSLHEKHILSKLAHVDDLEKQEEMVDTLGVVGSEFCIEELTKFLETPFDNLRWLTVRSIISILRDKSREYLYDMQFTDPYLKVRIWIAGYFAKLGDEISVQNLKDIYNHSNSKYKRYCVYKLVDIEPDNPMAIKTIRDGLNSDHPVIRYNSVRQLKEMNYPELEDDLIMFISTEKEEKILLKGIEIAGLKKFQKTIPFLQKIIQENENDIVKRKSALAIAEMFSSKQQT